MESNKLTKFFLGILIFSFFLSEILSYIDPRIGFLSYSVLITGCLFAIAKFKTPNKQGKLMTLLLIIPIFRITNFFLTIDYFWRMFALYGILVFLVTYYCFKFKLNPGYTKKNIWYFLLIILLGIGFGFLGNSFLDLEKHFGLLFLLPLIAYSEEVLFRGMLQPLIKENYGRFFSILIPSILYFIFSLGFGFLALFMFLIAIFSGLIYALSKNIYLVIILNFLIHLFLFVLF